MKEKDFQNEFKNRNKVVGVFELKIVKSNRLAYDAVKEHQEEALFNATAKGVGLYHKISDTPFIKGNPQRFTKPKPFDCFYLEEVPAYVVIMFYEPRKKKNVYYIPILDWLGAKSHSRMKSATEEEIEMLATIKQNYYDKVN